MSCVDEFSLCDKEVFLICSICRDIKNLACSWGDNDLIVYPIIREENVLIGEICYPQKTCWGGKSCAYSSIVGSNCSKCCCFYVFKYGFFRISHLTPSHVQAILAWLVSIDSKIDFYFFIVQEIRNIPDCLRRRIYLSFTPHPKGLWICEFISTFLCLFDVYKLLICLFPARY